MAQSIRTEITTLSRLSRWWSENRAGRLLLNPGIPLMLLTLLVISAIFAPWLAPHEALKSDMANQFIPPSWMTGGSSHYLLGTDYFGRDLLSRIIYGARVTAIVAFMAIIFSALLGTVIGLISGYIGGWFDALLMRITDATLSVPYLVIAIVFAAAIGTGMVNVIIILTVFQWPVYARQIRAEALAIRETDYVALARIAGVSHRRMLYKHFFANVIPTLLVLTTFHIGDVIMWEATLSFLGLGIPPPMPSWGSMVADGQAFIVTRWWISAFPGIAILLTVLAANIFGDWIRDKLDPKLRQL